MPWNWIYEKKLQTCQHYRTKCASIFYARYIFNCFRVRSEWFECFQRKIWMKIFGVSIFLFILVISHVLHLKYTYSVACRQTSIFILVISQCSYMNIILNSFISSVVGSSPFGIVWWLVAIVGVILIQMLHILNIFITLT